MSHLFVCSIGPVQDFIATARRSRDLWYGSWILSELAKSAAKAINDLDGNLIFPKPTDVDDLLPDSKFSAPNKIVAVTQGSPEGIADAALTAIQARLHNLRDEAFKHLQRDASFNYTRAKEHIDGLIEWYWASTELEDPTEYKTALDMAEHVLRARKATRNFLQIIGDRVPKSSLDGERESVIDETAFPRPNATEAEREASAKFLYTTFRAQPAERMSGVDLLKRLGQRKRQPDFRSTSHMAALPFLTHVDRNSKQGDAEELLRKIRTLIENAGISLKDEIDDGALVFASRLIELIPDQTQLQELTKQLEDLLSKYADTVRPEPYYAFLVADGDNMGKIISQITSSSEHGEMSVSLSKFSEAAKGIVEQHYGVPVYCGGDDLMAYLPLHTVLDCATNLAEQFSAEMKQFQMEPSSQPTLSIGIVVAHHVEPLSDTLDLARKAERVAKSVPGKHGLAITVSKRSGVDRTIKGKQTMMSARLKELIDWRRSNAIPGGIPYELQKLQQVLGRSESSTEALIAEATRIIKRKRESGGDQGIDNEKIATLRSWIQDERIDIEQLAFEMIIAGMFAKAIEMAEATRTGKAKL